MLHDNGQWLIILASVWNWPLASLHHLCIISDQTVPILYFNFAFNCLKAFVSLNSTNEMALTLTESRVSFSLFWGGSHFTSVFFHSVSACLYTTCIWYWSWKVMHTLVTVVQIPYIKFRFFGGSSSSSALCHSVSPCFEIIFNKYQCRLYFRFFLSCVEIPSWVYCKLVVNPCLQ